MLKTADGVMGRPDMCWMPMDTIGEPAGPLAVRFLSPSTPHLKFSFASFDTPMFELPFRYANIAPCMLWTMNIDVTANPIPIPYRRICIPGILA